MRLSGWIDNFVFTLLVFYFLLYKFILESARCIAIDFAVAVTRWLVHERGYDGKILITNKIAKTSRNMFEYRDVWLE